MSADFPVPPGFVISTAAYRDGRIEGGPGPELEREILEAYDSCGFSLVSVRSSATAEDGERAAWAGQLETYLQVERDALVGRVADCWASLRKERVGEYARQNDIPLEEVEVAVVVQEMVQADAAGVGFSVHPVTQESELMFLQAAPGLGEATVSGENRPDSWALSKNGAVLEYAAGIEGRTAALSQPQALECGRLLARVEAHFKRPMDIEWALAGERFFLLQARPITTLAPDYQQRPFDSRRGFRPFNRRPWQLFSSSLFAAVLERAARLAKVEPLTPLQIELAPGLVQICFPESDYDRLLDGVQQLCLERPDQVKKLLREGERWETRVQEWQQSAAPWSSLEEAVAACQEAMLSSTVVPRAVVDALTDRPEGDPQILELALRLRSASVYPWLFSSVLPPLLEGRLRELGCQGSFDPMRVVALGELTAPPVEALRERIGKVQEGWLFVHQRGSGGESVSMHPETGYLMARLARTRVPRQVADSPDLHGSTAYPGVVEGVARIVTGDQKVEFQEGDILVSVNANPSLMRYIVLASAIVTDEGGASCHAAIVARELGKPCLMGTGDATTHLRSGQRIRVDGFEQTVTIL